MDDSDTPETPSQAGAQNPGAAVPSALDRDQRDDGEQPKTGASPAPAADVVAQAPPLLPRRPAQAAETSGAHKNHVAETRAGSKTNRWGHIPAGINLLAALANIAVAVLIYRLAPKDSQWQDQVLDTNKEALVNISEAQEGIENGVLALRESTLTQRGAVAVLEEAAATLDDLRRSYDASLLKVLSVEGVELGTTPLTMGSGRRYDVQSFAGCPQMKITVSNSGDAAQVGSLRINGQIGIERFRCDPTKLPRPIQPNQFESVPFDLSTCVESKRISSCDGSGWLVVNVGSE
jgi:hypothetical protein